MGAMAELALVFVIIGTMVYAGMIYNGLVALRYEIDRAWANIDVVLKQRYDEISRLVEVCKGYMQYEHELLIEIAQARARYTQAASINEKAQAGGNLASSAQQLIATAENYPDLKANATFLQLQQFINDLENQIADRREFYNDAVNHYNARLQEMPDAFVARMLHLQPRSMFAASPAEHVRTPIAFEPAMR